jgi:flavin reductase (DIM6/NTAB) family NADH-FMN oxidoreductase RutF
VIPRPIGWISSIDAQGRDNLAPYSYFNLISDAPPMLMFSSAINPHDGGQKDTLKNIEETKEFVVNIVTFDLREKMNLSATDFDRGVSEIKEANLETLPSLLVKPLRIQGSPIHLECVYHQTIDLPSIDGKNSNKMVLGKIVGIHIDDAVIVDGKIDITKFKPIARLGYHEYCVIESVFNMKRPYIRRG